MKQHMTDFKRVLICVTTVALAASAYGATGDAPAGAPNTGATEVVTPAPPPAQPATPPSGFPPLVIPVAILVGIGVAVAAGDDDSVEITGSGTSGTR